MEFYIDKNSSTPVANQIQEQIKLAVMMGVFRDGDTLPSIRDIEKQTGINRSQIHKAYLALRQSGLLVLTRGKGTVVATATDSPRAVDENCRKLSKSIISKVRVMGLSPTAFARYLSRYAQENERNTPFIIYVDTHEEYATHTADEISQLWHVPVLGVTLQGLKAAIAKRPGRVKILANHLMCDSVRAMLSRNKSDAIPIELNSVQPAILAVEKIKPNSSVLVLYMPQPAHRVQFILAGVKRLMEPRGIRITSSPVRNMSHVRELLNKSEYDYYYVGPAARSEVPLEFRNDPRVLQVNTQLNPASLETARIRAGVII
ncbi:MAG: GntR family transcriptional regulator [Acidobacteria bacterium]|nr:GntR family transcriptional regulator [Acidobacteriota bacterium]